MSRVFWLLGCIFIVGLLLADPSHAELQLPVSIEILQHQLDMYKPLVASWERDACIEFSLLILVVVLGGAVAVLQKQHGKKWVAYAVAVCGILISTITYGTKEFFDADHKTLRKAAHEAKSKIFLASQHLEDAKTPEMPAEDRAVLLSQVDAIIAKLTEIAARVQDSVVGSNHSFNMLLSAYAQAVTPPAWTRVRQSETATVHRFVGEAVDASFPKAQSQAVANAKAAATSAVQVLPATVDRYARQVETYLEFDKKQGTYRVFTLLEINKAFVQPKP